MRYEYKVYTGPRDSLKSTLNAWAVERWRLVSSMYTEGTFTCIFEREVWQ